jgi:hypothetical protein
MQNTMIFDEKKFATISASNIVPVKIPDDYKTVAGGSIHDFMFRYVDLTEIPEDKAIHLSYYGLTSYTFKKSTDGQFFAIIETIGDPKGRRTVKQALASDESIWGTEYFQFKDEIYCLEIKHKKPTSKDGEGD